MKIYTENDVLMLGKRHNNNKRSYLLINPIQAKHIPSSPAASLDMMYALGKKISSKYPSAKLVIGFAETATAIAAAVSSCLGDGCIYIHTTREKIKDGLCCIEFNEEHSHAVEQKLYAENLEKYISDTNEIILVDDEISTGKTIMNIVKQMKSKYPVLSKKSIIAASIINRIGEENNAILNNSGIKCEYLVKLENKDYTKITDKIEISAPIDMFGKDTSGIKINEIELSEAVMNTRLGVRINEYNDYCLRAADEITDKIKNYLSKTDGILIIGTEEFMYPSIILAKQIESKGLVGSVKCHSATRSPIGINKSKDYPINDGYKIHSFYNNSRETYIYNIKKYDKVIIFTDSTADTAKALNDIAYILTQYGNNEIFFVKGGKNVQYI